MIQIEGMFSPSDYRRAYRLYYGYKYWFRGGESVVIACVAAAILHVAADLSTIRLFPALKTDSILLYGAFVAIVALLVARINRKRMAWDGEMRARELATWRFSDAGVEQLTAYSTTFLAWSAFKNYRGDENMVILVLREVAIMLAPRSLFAPEDWDRFTRLVREKLTQR